METTCGSYALKGLRASEDAAIATMLRDAGCIVIGLANLSVRLPYIPPGFRERGIDRVATGVGKQQRRQSDVRMVCNRRPGERAGHDMPFEAPTFNHADGL